MISSAVVRGFGGHFVDANTQNRLFVADCVAKTVEMVCRPLLVRHDDNDRHFVMMIVVAIAQKVPDGEVILIYYI